MIRRNGDWEEFQLAEFMIANKYPEQYARPGQTTVKVPYRDVPSGKKKFLEFEWLAEQWVYTDNNQEEKSKRPFRGAF